MLYNPCNVDSFIRWFHLTYCMHLTYLYLTQLRTLHNQI